jgi:DNA invertase Pin-like site-specific DNA recombinase
VILVTELTRWGRSMLDLLHTLQDLQAWNVSLIAQTGLQLDLRSAQGKLIASLMAALAEFERDLLRERVRSGIAAARKRGVVFGRRPGQRVKSDRSCAQSAAARRRRPVLSRNQPPARAEQEYGEHTRQHRQAATVRLLTLLSLR